MVNGTDNVVLPDAAKAPTFKGWLVLKVAPFELNSESVAVEPGELAAPKLLTVNVLVKVLAALT